MDLQKFLNSRQGGKMALQVSRLIPPRFGKYLSGFSGDFIASRSGLLMVQAIRSNMWVVGGEAQSASQLDLIVRQNLRLTAHSFYTLFHCLNEPQKLIDQVVLDPRAEELIQRSKEGKHGVIVVGVHMSNFDLVFQAVALHGLKAIGLSLPQPNEAVEWQHDLRRRSGLEILPATFSGLRQSIERLRNGEIIVTGIDRPISDPKIRPNFFGHPAHLPVHYIPLALKAEVPLVVAAALFKEDSKYHILCSDYIKLRTYPDRQTEIQNNAEMILEVAADFIRRAPEQWSIFLPVWPEKLAVTP